MIGRLPLPVRIRKGALRAAAAAGRAALWALKHGVFAFAARLALCAWALWFILRGAETLYGGVGYLVVGLLVWFELGRAGRKPKDDQAEEE